MVTLTTKMKTYKELGQYLVCEDGRVLSMKSSQIIKGTNVGRYNRLTLIGNDNHRVSIFRHRLIATLFIGDIPDGYEVHHIDGNTKNNNVSNLEIISPRLHNEISNVNPHK